MEGFRPEYCEEIDYEQGKGTNDPEYDAECEKGLVNTNDYGKGAFTPDGENCNSPLDELNNISPEEQQRLLLESQRIQEEREREEERRIQEEIMNGTFKG